jgi:hypothetical protein
LNLKIQKKIGFWIWVWILDFMDLWIFLGLDFGFIDFLWIWILDFFWVFRFLIQIQSKNPIFFGFEPLLVTLKVKNFELSVTKVLEICFHKSERLGTKGPCFLATFGFSTFIKVRAKIWYD